MFALLACPPFPIPSPSLVVMSPLRQSMSALTGDPHPYPQVFQFQNTILGSVQVSATGRLRATSQKLTGSQVLMVLNINKAY